MMSQIIRVGVKIFNTMKTIFLDRDGVINHDFGYVHQWENFKFIDGSIEALKILTKKRFSIVIITNQAGIAKGYFTEKQFLNLTKKFNEFCLIHNIKIVDTIYCPHHKDGIIKKYSKDCLNRKPNPGMFFKASKLHSSNLSKSIMVGDRITDIIAATNAGIKRKILINPDNTPPRFEQHLNFEIKKNLISLVKDIIC